MSLPIMVLNWKRLRITQPLLFQKPFRRLIYQTSRHLLGIRRRKVIHTFISQVNFAIKILTKIGRPQKQMPLHPYRTTPQVSPKKRITVEVKSLKDLALEPLPDIYEVQADFINGGCWCIKK